MTLTPYYEDDAVTLYHSDCLEVMPSLDVTADALLTDPPYFKVKQDEWDNQWNKAAEFLAWMGRFLDAAKPLVAANGSVWVFASPVMTSSVERLVGERFRVLNSIRWVKDAGWHQKAELAAMRSFLTPWEGIIFAEQYDDEYGDASDALRRQVFAPVGDYMIRAREAAGLSRGQLAALLTGYKNLDSATANVCNWELGKNLVSRQDYACWSVAVAVERPYEDICREYEDLRREYEDLRRPFTITHRNHSADIWNFPPVSGYPGKHPCEKPLSMLDHMITTSTRPGGLILDPFAGSGATLEAAKMAGRRVIGIEKDERWCERTANRLRQDVLDFGEVLA